MWIANPQIGIRDCKSRIVTLSCYTLSGWGSIRGAEYINDSNIIVLRKKI